MIYNSHHVYSWEFINYVLILLYFTIYTFLKQLTVNGMFISMVSRVLVKEDFRNRALIETEHSARLVILIMHSFP